MDAPPLSLDMPPPSLTPRPADRAGGFAPAPSRRSSGSEPSGGVSAASPATEHAFAPFPYAYYEALRADAYYARTGVPYGAYAELFPPVTAPTACPHASPLLRAYRTLGLSPSRRCRVRVLEFTPPEDEALLAFVQAYGKAWEGAVVEMMKLGFKRRRPDTLQRRHEQLFRHFELVSRWTRSRAGGSRVGTAGAEEGSRKAAGLASSASRAINHPRPAVRPALPSNSPPLPPSSAHSAQPPTAAFSVGATLPPAPSARPPRPPHAPPSPAQARTVPAQTPALPSFSLSNLPKLPSPAIPHSFSRESSPDVPLIDQLSTERRPSSSLRRARVAKRAQSKPYPFLWKDGEVRGKIRRLAAALRGEEGEEDEG